MKRPPICHRWIYCLSIDNKRKPPYYNINKESYSTENNNSINSNDYTELRDENENYLNFFYFKTNIINKISKKCPRRACSTYSIIIIINKCRIFCIDFILIR